MTPPLSVGRVIFPIIITVALTLVLCTKPPHRPNPRSTVIGPDSLCNRLAAADTLLLGFPAGPRRCIHARREALPRTVDGKTAVSPSRLTDGWQEIQPAMTASVWTRATGVLHRPPTALGTPNEHLPKAWLLKDGTTTPTRRCLWPGARRPMFWAGFLRGHYVHIHHPKGGCRGSLCGLGSTLDSMGRSMGSITYIITNAFDSHINGLALFVLFRLLVCHPAAL